MSRYDKSMTDPMKQELVDRGVEDITTPEAVDSFLKGAHCSVLFINSVCGCSAGIARPAFIQSLENHLLPEKIGTVFAGVDDEAVQRAREYLTGYPPSSPSIAFFREGEPVFMLQRKDIEGFDAGSLRDSIIRGYDKFAGAEVDEGVELKTPSQSLEKTVQEVKEDLEHNRITLLDCRGPEEREIAAIPGSDLITQTLAEEMIQSWDRKRPLVFYCHYGNSSLQAALYFKQRGFENCTSMAGGIAAWSREIDPDMPTY